MGRQKCLYSLIALFLMVAPVKAQMPAQLDSLKKYVQLATGFESSASMPDSVLAWAINSAIQKVCTDFDAVAKLDTVTLKKDSTGAVINSDFLRTRWVQKIVGDTMWVPMGEVSGDTLYLQIVDTSDTKLKPLVATQPRLWMWHNKLFTHPKYAKGTVSQTFLVAYWAADQWITDGDTSTAVRPKYLNSIIPYAAYLLNLRRGNFNEAQLWLVEYKGNIPK